MPSSLIYEFVFMLLHLFKFKCLKFIENMETHASEEVKFKLLLSVIFLKFAQKEILCRQNKCSHSAAWGITYSKSS